MSKAQLASAIEYATGLRCNPKKYSKPQLQQLCAHCMNNQPSVRANRFSKRTQYGQDEQKILAANIKPWALLRSEISNMPAPTERVTEQNHDDVHIPARIYVEMADGTSFQVVGDPDPTVRLLSADGAIRVLALSDLFQVLSAALSSQAVELVRYYQDGGYPGGDIIYDSKNLS